MPEQNASKDNAMLRTVLIGLSILVLGVFAYVGYNSYAVSRHPAQDDIYTGATVTSSAESKPVAGEGPTFPITAPTGEAANGSPEVTSQGAPITGGVSAPATDTIKPNPTNGEIFGGSGHYQLYRQGDLTWRLDTDTGDSCVIFATDEEWHKPKVYKAGCRGK